MTRPGYRLAASNAQARALGDLKPTPAPPGPSMRGTHTGIAALVRLAPLRRASWEIVRVSVRPPYPSSQVEGSPRTARRGPPGIRYRAAESRTVMCSSSAVVSDSCSAVGFW